MYTTESKGKRKKISVGGETRSLIELMMGGVGMRGGAAMFFQDGVDE